MLLLPRLLLASLLFGVAGRAQIEIPANLSAGIMQAVLTNVFGTNTAFSSFADVSFLNDERREVLGSTVGVSLLDQHFRLYKDLTNTRLPGIRLPLPDARKARLTLTVNIIRFDRGRSILTYPALKAYCEQSLAPDKVGSDIFQIRRTALGEEKVGNDLCHKEKIVLGDPGDSTNNLTMVIWRAPAVRNFPMQIEFDLTGSFLRLRFKEPRFVRLDAALFDVPKGYRRFNSVDEIEASAR